MHQTKLSVHNVLMSDRSNNLWKSCQAEHLMDIAEGKFVSAYIFGSSHPFCPITVKLHDSCIHFVNLQCKFLQLILGGKTFNTLCAHRGGYSEVSFLKVRMTVWDFHQVDTHIKLQSCSPAIEKNSSYKCSTSWHITTPSWHALISFALCFLSSHSGLLHLAEPLAFAWPVLSYISWTLPTCSYRREEKLLVTMVQHSQRGHYQ